jgi:hypothetical protein
MKSSMLSVVEFLRVLFNGYSSNFSWEDYLSLENVILPYFDVKEGVVVFAALPIDQDKVLMDAGILRAFVVENFFPMYGGTDAHL